jgi:PAB1-binding protein PBP1
MANQQTPYINEYQTFFPSDAQQIPQVHDKIASESANSEGNAVSFSIPKNKFPQSPSHNRTDG